MRNIYSPQGEDLKISEESRFVTKTVTYGVYTAHLSNVLQTNLCLCPTLQVGLKLASSLCKQPVFDTASYHAWAQ